MKRILIALGLAVAASATMSSPVVAEKPGHMAVRTELYLNSVSYDPKRDPEADLKVAIEKAQADKKRILLDVGGEWCSWCHILDDYLASNKGVGDAFAASFVIVKVNWSPDNKNAAFLSKYPKVDGYPHFFVLSSSGKLLSNQPTSPLEQGESYNRERMLKFAKAWAHD